MRVASAIALVLFGLAAAVQWNDPDAVGWIAVYLITAATALAGALGRFLPGPTFAIGVLLGIGAILRWPEGGLLPGADSMAMANLEVEETREALGLLLCSTWALFLAWAGRRRSGVVALLPLFLALGCSAVDGRVAGDGATVEVPLDMAFRPVPRLRVASDLANPRGMLVRGEELLVAVAGDGDPGRPASGGLLALADLDGDGRYESPGERRVLLEGRVSRNVIDIVRRFSGRLLAIDLGRGTVGVIAEGLDGPTNLARGGRFLYVAQGMGTPGRPIPGPEGPVPLAGVIDRFE